MNNPTDEQTVSSNVMPPPRQPISGLVMGVGAAIALIVVLVIGFGLGKLLTEPDEKIVEVAVEVTPQVCLDAIETAEEITTLLAGEIQAIADALSGDSVYSYLRGSAIIDQNSARIDALSPKYQREAAACRATKV